MYLTVLPPQPQEAAASVRCAMTQLDIDSGRMIMQLGFAPLEPAEFVILKFLWKMKQGQ